MSGGWWSWQSWPRRCCSGCWRGTMSERDPRAWVSDRLVCAIEEHELTLRLIEAVSEAGLTPRPDGWSAEKLLERMDQELVTAMRLAARAAILYVAECIMRSNPVDEAAA